MQINNEATEQGYAFRDTDFFIMEHCRTRSVTPRSKGIATKLVQACRKLRGVEAATVVVVDRPEVIVPAVRRNWLALIQKLAKERSSTLVQGRIATLTEEIEHMQATRFVVGLPGARAQNNSIYFVPREVALRAIAEIDGEHMALRQTGSAYAE